MEILNEEGFMKIVKGNLLKKILKESEGECLKKDHLVSGEYINLQSFLYKGNLKNGT
jgi:hypothetical protein